MSYEKKYVVPCVKVNQMRTVSALLGSSPDPYQDPKGEQTGGESSGEDY